MRCGRCGKNFDEEMYSGICPHCGRFNNRRAEPDVSEYFSAKFDDGSGAYAGTKTSTGTQAAAQHAKLHEMYDVHKAHGKGAGTHEKLHKAYDTRDPHGNQDRARKMIITSIVAFALVWIAAVSFAMGNFGVIIFAVIVWQFVFVCRKLLRKDGKRGKKGGN